MRVNVGALKLNLLRVTIDAQHFDGPSLMTMQADQGDGDLVGRYDRFVKGLPLDHVAVTRNQFEACCFLDVQPGACSTQQVSSAFDIFVTTI
jgi:hypothetical protein